MEAGGEKGFVFWLALYGPREQGVVIHAQGIERRGHCGRQGKWMNDAEIYRRIDELASETSSASLKRPGSNQVTPRSVDSREDIVDTFRIKKAS